MNAWLSHCLYKDGKAIREKDIFLNNKDLNVKEMKIEITIAKS